MTTTTDVFEALQNLVPGTKGNPKAAKIIADYLEESKHLNVEQMKEIFMTKDDKIELIDRVGQTKVDMIKWFIGVGAVQTATILGFLYFMLKH